MKLPNGEPYFTEIFECISKHIHELMRTVENTII